MKEKKVQSSAQNIVLAVNHSSTSFARAGLTSVIRRQGQPSKTIPHGVNCQKISILNKTLAKFLDISFDGRYFSLVYVR